MLNFASAQFYLFSKINPPSFKVLDKLVSYNKGILTSDSGGPASVVFSVVVAGFGDIDDNSGTLSLNLEVSIEWFDLRLNFLNLSPNM